MVKVSVELLKNALLIHSNQDTALRMRRLMLLVIVSLASLLLCARPSAHAALLANGGNIISLQLAVRQKGRQSLILFSLPMVDMARSEHLHRAEEAERLYAGALAVGGARTRVLRNLSLLYALGCDYGSAAVQLERWLAEQPGIKSYERLILATLYLADGQTWRASDALGSNQLLEQMLGMLQARAEGLRSEGNIEEAKGLYMKIAEIAPSRAEGYYGLGDLYWAEGRNQDVLLAYQAALERDRHGGIDWIAASGRVALLTEDWEKAVEAFASLKKERPNYAWGQIHLGYALYRAGRLEEAIEVLETATSLDPTISFGHLWLGYAYLDSGELEQAVLRFQEAIALDTRMAAAHYGLSQAYHGLCLLDQAIEEVKSALELAPDNEAYRAYLTDLLIESTTPNRICSEESDLR